MKNENIKLKNIKCCQTIIENKKNILKKNILINGFDYKKSFIIISKYNEIINGHHRYCALLEIFGPEHEIIVKKKKTSKFVHYLFTGYLIFFGSMFFFTIFLKLIIIIFNEFIPN